MAQFFGLAAPSDRISEKVFTHTIVADGLLTATNCDLALYKKKWSILSQTFYLPLSYHIRNTLTHFHLM